MRAPRGGASRQKKKILLYTPFLGFDVYFFLFGLNRGLGDRCVWAVCLSGHGGVFFGFSPFFLLLHDFPILLYIIMLHRGSL